MERHADVEMTVIEEEDFTHISLETVVGMPRGGQVGKHQGQSGDRGNRGTHGQAQLLWLLWEERDEAGKAGIELDGLNNFSGFWGLGPASSCPGAVPFGQGTSGPNKCECVREAVGGVESGLAGLYRKGVSAGQSLANSRNWLALGGTVSPESKAPDVKASK